MSECVWAKITIGGLIAERNLEELQEAVAGDLGGREAPEGSEGFVEYYKEGEHLVVEMNEMPNGEFPLIEAVCRTLELTYLRVSDGCSAFAAEEVWWDPTCDGDTLKEHSLDHDGNHVVGVEEVAKCLAGYWAAGTDKETGRPPAEEGQKLAEALGELMDEWPDTPVFEVLED